MTISNGDFTQAMNVKGVEDITLNVVNAAATVTISSDKVVEWPSPDIMAISTADFTQTLNVKGLEDITLNVVNTAVPIAPVVAKEDTQPETQNEEVVMPPTQISKTVVKSGSIQKKVVTKKEAVSVESGYTMASSNANGNGNSNSNGRGGPIRSKIDSNSNAPVHRRMDSVSRRTDSVTRRSDETPDGSGLPRVIRGGINGQFSKQKKATEMKEKDAVLVESGGVVRRKMDSARRRTDSASRRNDETPDGSGLPRVTRGGINGHYNRKQINEEIEEPTFNANENIFVPMDDIKRGW
jgi:hypothetical protein